MFVRWSALTVALFALSLAGCEGDDDPRRPGETEGGSLYAAEEKVLSEQRSGWDAAARNSYEYHYRRSCFCPDVGKTAVVTVTDGEVIEAFYLEDGTYLSDAELQRIYTIDGLFDEIQEAIDDRVHELSVEYHETLGYPTQIAIDVDEMMVDEEITHYASELH